MNDTNNTAPIKADPGHTLTNSSTAYGEKWLVKYTLIGGVLFALGSFYLPVPKQPGNIYIWFWENIFGESSAANPTLEILNLVIFTIPLLLLKLVPRNILAISLLSFLVFLMLSYYKLDSLHTIPTIVKALIPISHNFFSMLLAYLIIAIFILSTLCRTLQEQQYPVILQRIAGISLLLVLLMSQFFVRDIANVHGNVKPSTDTLLSTVFIISAIIYSLFAISQSFRKAPAALVNLMFFIMLGIALIGVSSFLLSLEHQAAKNYYEFSRRMIGSAGLMILLWCSIVASCLQYTGRQ